MFAKVFLSPAARNEIRANLKLALPLIAAQLAGVGMGAIDTVFAGRLGRDALAAVAVGVNLNVIFFVFGMGLLMAASPIVAQMRGAGRDPADIGVFMRRARNLSLIVAVVWFLGLNLFAAPVLSHLHLSPETARLALDFERALSFSAFGMSLWFVQRFSMEGAGVTRPIFLAGAVGLAMNALLDWVLLFGHFGLPALGVVGCGIATSLCTLMMAGLLRLAFAREPSLRIYRPSPVARVVPENARSMFQLGLPIALTVLAEAGLFTGAAILMSAFGDVAIAAYQVALNFASLVFMIPLGIAQATTVRVGLAAGARDWLAARFRGRAGMGLALGNAVSNAAIMALGAPLIVALYTEDAGIATQAVGFLYLAALFQLFDGLQTAANGALRGIEDTRLPLAVTIVAYWLVGMPVALGLAFGLGIGPSGLWYGLCAGLGVAAAGLTTRFLRRTARMALANP